MAVHPNQTTDKGQLAESTVALDARTQVATTQVSLQFCGCELQGFSGSVWLEGRWHVAAESSGYKHPNSLPDRGHAAEPVAPFRDDEVMGGRVTPSCIQCTRCGWLSPDGHTCYSWQRSATRRHLGSSQAPPSVGDGSLTARPIPVQCPAARPARRSPTHSQQRGSQTRPPGCHGYPSRH